MYYRTKDGKIIYEKYTPPSPASPIQQQNNIVKENFSFTSKRINWLLILLIVLIILTLIVGFLYYRQQKKMNGYNSYIQDL